MPTADEKAKARAVQPVLMVAIETGFIQVQRKGHGEVLIAAGQTILPGDHPAVLQCPTFFRPVEATA